MAVRLCALLPLLAALAGCELYDTATTAAPDKVNLAFPLREDLVTARNGLVASLAADPAAQQAAADEVARMMTVRALACSAGASIGRFDKVADVKRKVGSADCFREQDAKLADWLGMRRVGIAMRLPPLAEPAPLPARFAVTQAHSAAGLIIADQANIAAVQGTRGEYTVLELPSGRKLASIDGPGTQTHASSLSPNGRVLALASGHSGVKFHDAEAGHLLWSSDKYTQVVAWLPQAEATLVAEKGAPVLVDHRRAAAEPVPLAIGNFRWSTPVPGATPRVLVGGGPAAAMLGYARGTDGTVKLEPLRQWRLNGNGSSSGRPFLMAEGRKLFYVVGNDLAWLDLESGEQGSWPMQSIQAHGYAKLSETQLYLDASNGTDWRRTPRILDVAKGTIAEAERDPQEGMLIPLVPRVGYARRGHSQAVALATTATPTGEEQPLDKVLADAGLARELAKLQAAQQAAMPPGSVPAPSSAGVYPSWGARSLPAGAAVPAIPAARPLLAKVPADARVSVVGVYEAASGSHGHGQARKAGTIRVTVAPGRGPLVLVLASYEPVTWLVQDGGRPISAILLSGYHPSQVIGTNAEVHRIGSQYAYKPGSAEYERLKQEIARYVAAPVQNFQGTYSGKEFSVY